MSIVVLLKFVHVLAAITAVGSNLTYAFWMSRAGRDRDRLVWTIETIHRLDRRIANPSYGLLLVTGVLMVLGGLYSFETRWLATAIVLYVAVAVVGITLYAPAIRRQLAAAQADPTSAEYEAAARRSALLGVVTVAIVLVIVFLMVVKPF
ncbi:MAG TPA: DUF2269 family protein [Candidatus Limnocylindrales bacterium]|nr:DUF2269 family protein [Candidatus Limnocylindrales bacterium]